MALSYDEILQKVNGNGRFELKVFILIFIFSIPGAVHNMSTVFNMVEPNFRCAIPWLTNDTYDITSDIHAQWVNDSIPWDEQVDQFSQCWHYTPLNSSNVFSGQEVKYSRTDLTKCGRWVYNLGENEATIISDLDLVCDRLIIKTHVQMIMMVGLLIGAPIFGYISDIIGRKNLMIVLVLLMSAVGFAFSFLSSVGALLIGRLCIAVLSVGTYVIAFTLASEMFVPEKRCMSTMLTMYGWSAGLFCVAGIYYFARDWKTAQLIFSVPSVVFIAYWWLLPESPRWLISKGRYKAAREVLENIAKMNKTTLPEKYAAQLEATGRALMCDKMKEEEVQVKRMKIWHILRHRKVLIIFLIASYNWFVVSTCYYGLSLNVDSLVEGDLYLNFTIMAVLEVFAYVMVHCMVDRVGRKPIYCSCMLLAGISCLATMGPVLAETDMKWINMVLSNLGKFGTTACFAIIYMYTTELLPTVIRNSGLGICSFLGRLGGIVSPYLAALGKIMGGPMADILPLTVIGIASLLAGVLMLLMPETKGKKLPETFEDVENFNKKSKPAEIEISSDDSDLPLRLNGTSSDYRV